MKNLFQTDASRVLLYMDENAGWLQTINNQAAELPRMEKMLSDKESIAENRVAERTHFKNWLKQQEEQMKQLNSELSEQQKRLETDAAGHSLYDIDALCSQDILRDRIRQVEQRFIELKCSFMRFLSGL